MVMHGGLLTKRIEAAHEASSTSGPWCEMETLNMFPSLYPSLFLPLTIPLVPN